LDQIKKDVFYLDCEFDGHNGPLLSVALVRDYHDSIYIKTDKVAKDPWVLSHVIPVINNHECYTELTLPSHRVAEELLKFIGPCDHPIFICDSLQDAIYLSYLLVNDAEGNYKSSPFLSLHIEVKNIDSFPTSAPNLVQHNAWCDAMALMYKLRESSEREENIAMPLYVEETPELISDISVRIGEEEVNVSFGKSIPHEDAVKRAFQILETFVQSESKSDLLENLTDLIQATAQGDQGYDSPVDRGDAEGLARNILKNREFITGARK